VAALASLSQLAASSKMRPPPLGQHHQRHQATGHWRAINPGVAGSMTVTGGALDPQVRAVSGVDLSDSQADSAGFDSRLPHKPSSAP
jgi:hypothetical protein